MIAFTDLTVQNHPCVGWILYTDEESRRNRHYIDLYRKACDKYGLSIRLGIYNPPHTWNQICREQLSSYIHETAQIHAAGNTGAKQVYQTENAGMVRQEAAKPWYGRFRRPAFVINRTRDYRLALELEKLGIRVYNHSRVAELGNDKAKACRFMELFGIPMMPTVYGVQTPPWYPAVVKSCGGHGGTEVCLIKDRHAWEEWKWNVYQPQKEYIVQKAASDLGRDVRVYVVGNRIAASVLRSCDQDFRSNFCLGGTATLYGLNDKERGLVQRILAILHMSAIPAGLPTADDLSVPPVLIGMAGIDFIFHHGQMVFNEIEDMAGARSLYLLSDYDIVDEYIKYIQEEIGV